MIELNKYEITRLIAARAEQLACGAPPLVKTNKDSTAYTISREEFDNKVIPLAVVRIKNNVKEVINVK